MAGFKIEGLILAIVWVLLLIFIAWPISWMISPFWILLLPFKGLPGGLGSTITDVCDFLERFVKWPEVIGPAVFSMEERFPAPQRSGYSVV
mmetsp:Transcript_8029/g.16075  ORF Transcript_8029/g.16075 Transcript_8029/m.16075 type:complete len:91 (+) Transcript_8029:113-385(+)|eukprot:scaffold2915_cov181-Amphora_coffeaeformis.AAC.2